MWTFGISQNNDDGLSFSSHLIYNDTKFTTQLVYAGITNRGCKIDDEFVKGRYDILAIDAAYNDLYYDHENYFFSFQPLIGFAFAGDLALDEVQNFVHRTSSINTVNIPYEEGYRYAFRIGLQSQIGYSFPFAKRSAFALSLGVKNLNSITLETENAAFINATVLSCEKPILNFSLGYEMTKGYTPWSTQKLYHYVTEGWYGGFNFRFGALAVDYKTHFKSRVGYCNYSCDLLSFAKKSTFKEADLYYSVLLTRILNKNYHESEFSIDLAGSDFYLGLCNRYFSAAHIKQEYRAHGAVSSYYMTLSYAHDFRYVTPFISTGLGFTNFNLITYKDPTSEHIYDIDSAYTFSADINIGLKLLPQNFLTWDNTSYSILLKGGVVIHPDGAKAKRYLLPYSPAYDNFSFLPYLSIGGVVAIDLI